MKIPLLDDRRTLLDHDGFLRCLEDLAERRGVIRDAMPANGLGEIKRFRRWIKRQLAPEAVGPRGSSVREPIDWGEDER